MPKLSGYPNKSGFMLRIKGGYKREGDCDHKTASNQVEMVFFAYGVKNQYIYVLVYLKHTFYVL